MSHVVKKKNFCTNTELLEKACQELGYEVFTGQEAVKSGLASGNRDTLVAVVRIPGWRYGALSIHTDNLLYDSDNNVQAVVDLKVKYAAKVVEVAEQQMHSRAVAERVTINGRTATRYVIPVGRVSARG